MPGRNLPTTGERRGETFPSLHTHGVQGREAGHLRPGERANREDGQGTGQHPSTWSGTGAPRGKGSIAGWQTLQSEGKEEASSRSSSLPRFSYGRSRNRPTNSKEP